MVRSLALLFLCGCARQLTVSSLPEGAVLALPSGEQVTTPAEVTLQWRPLSKDRVVVTAPGYRPLELPVNRLVLGPWFSQTREDLRLDLVPEHGPSGTWSPASEGID